MLEAYPPIFYFFKFTLLILCFVAAVENGANLQIHMKMGIAEYKLQENRSLAGLLHY